MIECMIPDSMTACENTLINIRMLADIIADAKKSSGYIIITENAQHKIGWPWNRSVIESKVKVIG